MEKRELVAFLFFVILVYCGCCVTLPHGAVGYLQCVIVVFPDHTHLLFLKVYLKNSAGDILSSNVCQPFVSCVVCQGRLLYLVDTITD